MPRILLHTGCGLGNVLMTAPLIASLHDAGWEVNLLITECLFFQGCIDALSGWKVHRMEDCEENYRKEQFDVAVNCFSHRGKDFRFINAKEIHKYPVKDDANEYGEANWNLAIAKLLGVPKKHEYHCNYTDFSKKTYDVGIHIGCNPRKYWIRKKWNYFGSLIEMLRGREIAVLAENSNELIGKDVDHYLGLRIHDIASVIKNCKVFVCNDSGLMHIANALRVPTIGIFGSTSINKAVSKNSTIYPVSLGLTCSPCLHSDRWKKCGDFQCIYKIYPERVHRKVEQLLCV